MQFRAKSRCLFIFAGFAFQRTPAFKIRDVLQPGARLLPDLRETCAPRGLAEGRSQAAIPLRAVFVPPALGI
jgi:hypothetical protein